MIPLLAMLLLALPAWAKTLDKTLAIVNGEAILLSEFDRASEPVLEQFKRVTPLSEQTPARIKEIKTKVLEQLIDDRLLTQEAKKQSIKVSKLEISDGVRRVKQRFADEAEFQKELRKEGIAYEQFEKRISDQIAVIKLIDQEIKAKIPTPTETEVKNLYEAVNAIAHDKPIPAGYKASELDDIKTLAKLLQHRFGERVRARHILIRVEPRATAADKAKAREKMVEVQKKLKKGTDFVELARQYSEDPGSKERGGDLGYFTRGEMTPPFEKAAFGLEVGQMSDIVETDFGFHLIRVEEKKAASKFTFAEIQEDLKDFLFQQRASQKFEAWIDNLRKKSAIKINEFT